MTDTKPITVLIADDDAGARRDLLHFFASAPEYEVVAQAADGLTAVQLCRELRPNVALLDIRMPLMDGLAATRAIRSQQLAHCVVMLTSFSEPEYIDAAIEAGAFGYLVKPFRADAIGPALEISLDRSREYYRLSKDTRAMERQLEGKEVTDQAKLLLMETRSFTEEEAYRYIREISRRRGLSMARVAAGILAGADAP